MSSQPWTVLEVVQKLTLLDSAPKNMSLSELCHYIDIDESLVKSQGRVGDAEEAPGLLEFIVRINSRVIWEICIDNGGFDNIANLERNSDLFLSIIDDCMDIHEDQKSDIGELVDTFQDFFDDNEVDNEKNAFRMRRLIGKIEDNGDFLDANIKNLTREMNILKESIDHIQKNNGGYFVASNTGRKRSTKFRINLRFGKDFVQNHVFYVSPRTLNISKKDWKKLLMLDL